jgi:hypothetical protein
VYGDTYFLAVTARVVRPVHAEARQGFAVVVTLEHESDAVNVLRLARAWLGSGRVRIRVPATK